MSRPHVDVVHADMREALAEMATNGVRFDAVVSDPPYHFASIVKRFGAANAAPAKSDGATGVYHRSAKGFMSKTWDGGDIAFRPETWALVGSVMKPGAHLVAFGAPKNFHRLVCAIEDAGFEIRDQLMWMFGTGFPKSHDVAKGIDRHNGDERPVVGRETLSNDIRGGALLDVAHGTTRPALERDITSAASAASAAWEGWGTALKPAYEPIVLARWPLDGSVAANVLKHGVGGLNIDACRVEWAGTEDAAAAAAAAGFADSRARGTAKQSVSIGKESRDGINRYDPTAIKGRWPANLVHDGSDEVVAVFPRAPGQRAPVTGNEGNSRNVFNPFAGNAACQPRGDEGSAARFFYSAKADAGDRVGSKHPTVKPVDLMRWLVRLIVPKGGRVLDPFAGSGTTGMAALAEGCHATLIEREAEYVADIRRRIAHVSGGDAPLFAAAE